MVDANIRYNILLWDSFPEIPKRDFADGEIIRLFGYGRFRSLFEPVKGIWGNGISDSVPCCSVLTLFQLQNPVTVRTLMNRTQTSGFSER